MATPVMRTNMRPLSIIAYVAFLLFIALAGAEAYLRWTFLAPNGYYVWPPYLDRTLQPDPEITPGVEGLSRFVINGDGIRGDEIPTGDAIRILAVGGSTTEELFLTQDETWTGLLQRKLSRALGAKRSVWVGNMGRSSVTSRHHVLQLEKALPRLPQMDVIVSLVGINDLLYWLASGYSPEMSEEQHLALAFIFYPRADSAFLENFALYHFANYVETGWRRRRSGVVQTETADWIVPLREKRQSVSDSELITELPDLTGGLGRFRAHLHRMIDIAERHGSRLVLITQPVLWKADMTEEAKRLLWAAGAGLDWVHNPDVRYYAPAVLAAGMDRFNRVLLEVCQERHLVCIDLAKEVPKDARFFYDDMHFTEAGARRVTDVVFNKLWTVLAGNGNSEQERVR